MTKRFIVLALLLLFTLSPAFASNDVTIIINGQEIQFDEDSGFPFIDENGRTQVPFRRALESFGAEVDWDNESFTAIGRYKDIVIEAPIGGHHIKKNLDYYTVDSGAILLNNRSYLPIRAVFEGFGADVRWNNELQSVEIIRDALTTASFEIIQPYHLGMSTEVIKSIHGEAKEVLPSHYDFDWWIYYDNNYRHYYQLGVADDKLVALYTASDLENWNYEVTVNMSRSNAIKAQETLASKNNTYDLTAYYDQFQDNRVNSLLIIDKSYNTSTLATEFAENKNALTRSYERQVFHISNANRYKFDLVPMIWNENLSEVARAHSIDMANNNYFDHTNLKGESPFDRMKNSGLSYRSAAENIAAGQTTPVDAVETWMNSDGHRKNILSDIQEIGVGIDYDANAAYRIYYTQKFITQ